MCDRSATLLPNATGDVSNTATATSTNSSNSTSNLAYDVPGSRSSQCRRSQPNDCFTGQSVTYTNAYSNIGSATTLTHPDHTLPPNTTVKDPAAFSLAIPAMTAGPERYDGIYRRFRPAEDQTQTMK